MTTQQGQPGTGQKSRLRGILPKRFGAALGAPGEGRAMRSKPIRPISLFIAMLVTLATILGVIGLGVSMGSVQATPGDGASVELLGRTTLGPFRVNQPPDFMIHSRNEKDVAMTKITISEGGHSGWHTHPGLTIVIVTEGKVKLTRFTEKDGCIAQEFGPGLPQQGFFEVANEVHIAENVGTGDAVLQAIRLNFPVGEPITDSSPEDPGC
jgi:hypothetical protein